ncbi:glycosyltransferase family A protein [Methanolobus vulcani]|uniref:glycosyltransferase family A protein n=1 Tax=Methanolobus vulcani TaxID=38026 RepID=UPI0018ACA7A9|nr:glycosyltransferase family 2 protein [Methanolobus vulcani]
MITPAKNEELNIEKLIFSVMNQTLKPLLWLIIDDGSTDSTPEIIHKAELEHEWVTSITLNEKPRDVHKHYVEICNNGFRNIIDIAASRGLDFNYIGVVDADIILENTFFENLITEFEKNSSLGIASGAVTYIDENGNEEIEYVKNDEPVGAMRLWNIECFNETNGYYSSYAPDSVSNVLALLNGWEVKLFYHIKAIHLRKTRTAEGVYNGYKLMAVSDYYRNYHPLFLILKSLSILIKRPLIGISYIHGLIYCISNHIEKIDDVGVKNYYYTKTLSDIKKIVFYSKSVSLGETN